MQWHHYSPAFTLIEMLVSIGIMMIIFAIGVNSYNYFNTKQTILGSVGEVKTYLQKAQSKAQSGDTGGCEELGAYQVDLHQNEIVLVPLCEDHDGNDMSWIARNEAVSIYTLPANVQVVVTPTNAIIRAKVLHGAFDLRSPSGNSYSEVNIIVSYRNQAYHLTLDRGGSISNESW